MTKEDDPRAMVRKIDGQLVLDDPDALAMARAVGKHNCKLTFEANKDRVAHFKQRVEELERSPEDTIIVLLNVDDPCGEILADILMPGADWDAIRAQGQVPYARGLCTREGLKEGLELFDKEAAAILKAMTGLAVLVVDYGVAEVFDA